MVLFSALNLPKAWRPLFLALSRLGWDLDQEEEMPMDWAIRPSLCFRNGEGRTCYLSFFQLPMWCGNIRQKGGITIVGLTRSLPKTLQEAEEHRLALESNWEEEVESFLLEALIPSVT